MKCSRKKYVVDTNVPIVANCLMKPEKCPGIPEDCHIKCSESIQQVMEKGCVVIDEDGEVLAEYGNKLCHNPREPGIGHAFLQWVTNHQGDPSKVLRISLTPEKNGSYRQFPRGYGIDSINKGDHKFIALASACSKVPVILQATDRKWWKYKKAFMKAGLDVCFLCPRFVKKKRGKKTPKKRKSRQ